MKVNWHEHTGSCTVHYSKGRRWARGRCLSCGFCDRLCLQCTRGWWGCGKAAQSSQVIAGAVLLQRKTHPRAVFSLLSPHAWDNGKPGFCNNRIHKRYLILRQWQVKIWKQVAKHLTWFFHITISTTHKQQDPPPPFSRTYPHGSWKYEVSVWRSRACWLYAVSPLEKSDVKHHILPYVVSLVNNKQKMRCRTESRPSSRDGDHICHEILVAN